MVKGIVWVCRLSICAERGRRLAINLRTRQDNIDFSRTTMMRVRLCIWWTVKCLALNPNCFYSIENNFFKQLAQNWQKTDWPVRRYRQEISWWSLLVSDNYLSYSVEGFFGYRSGSYCLFSQSVVRALNNLTPIRFVCLWCLSTIIIVYVDNRKTMIIMVGFVLFYCHGGIGRLCGLDIHGNRLPHAKCTYWWWIPGFGTDSFIYLNNLFRSIYFFIFFFLLA